jgi:two-component sensor histidine kinase
MLARLLPCSSADEERQRLIACEMQHRLRNTLAIVQAIVRQSVRNAATKEQAEALITGRICAISGANDLLAHQGTERASLRQLVGRMLSLHDGAGISRFQVDGRDLYLDLRTTLGLALILHEMATNAAKYGALSNDRGHVELSWSLSDHLRLRWVECGGPAVEPPLHEGFGTRLIREALRDAGADIELTFPTAGAVLNLRIPLINLQRAN